MLARLFILVRRMLRAKDFGVFFRGTTSFRLPGAIRLRGQKVPVSTTGESGLGLDFINLALDDEYGLRSFSIPPRTVLDIGANCGLFSLLAAHYFPAAAIHAYEPNPRVFAHAARNLPLVGAKVFEEGVGSHAGRAVIQDVGESRMAQTQFVADGTIRIIPLREAVERLGQKVDLLKLDCEGAEWDIFEDLQAFEKVDCIRMEYHLVGGHSLDDLHAWIQKAGYRIDRLAPNSGFGIVWLSREAKDPVGGVRPAA